jgi:hypothetical protein
MVGMSRNTEQIQQLFTYRFVDASEDRGLFRTFSNSSEASYEDAEPTSELELINLHCSNELRSKFKEGNLLNFHKCLLKDKSLHLQQETAVVCRLVWKHLTFVNKLSYW